MYIPEYKLLYLCNIICMCVFTADCWETGKAGKRKGTVACVAVGRALENGVERNKLIWSRKSVCFYFETSNVFIIIISKISNNILTLHYFTNLCKTNFPTII